MNISNLTIKRIQEYLAQGKRFDKRGLLDFRDIEIETGISNNAEGSARVRIGKTEVVAGVKLDVATPYTDHEDEGTLITSLELTPMSSPDFDYGPPRIEAIEMARIIDRGIRESKFIDFKKLCIKPGEKVWGIFVDIYSMNGDGNILDVASLAAVAALMTAVFPKYDEKEERVVYGERTNKKLPLMKSPPLNLTFHKIKDHIILDPCYEEEAASEARLSFSLMYSEDKEILIHAMQKGNEVEFKEKEVFEIIDLAEKKYEELHEILSEKIEKAQKQKKEE